MCPVWWKYRFEHQSSNRGSHGYAHIKIQRFSPLRQKGTQWRNWLYAACILVCAQREYTEDSIYSPSAFSWYFLRRRFCDIALPVFECFLRIAKSSLKCVWQVVFSTTQLGYTLRIANRGVNSDQTGDTPAGYPQLPLWNWKFHVEIRLYWLLSMHSQFS